jgi:hypothetical protein
MPAPFAARRSRSDSFRQTFRHSCFLHFWACFNASHVLAQRRPGGDIYLRESCPGEQSIEVSIRNGELLASQV